MNPTVSKPKRLPTLLQLSKLSADEISCTVSLRQAALATTPRKVRDLQWRMRGAAHEAAHHVAHAYYGIAPLRTLIPVFNPKPADYRKNHVGWWGDMPACCSDYLSPGNPFDAVSDLEDAVSDLVGQVFENAFGGAWAQGKSLPYFNPVNSDVESARSNLRGYREWAGNLMDHPLVQPYIRERMAEIDAEPAPGPWVTSYEELDALWWDQIVLAALRIVAWHWHLIDAVGALILIRCGKRGEFTWSKADIKWLMHAAQSQIGDIQWQRTPEFAVPDWLSVHERRAIPDFDALRDMCNALQALIPNPWPDRFDLFAA